MVFTITQRPYIIVLGNEKGGTGKSTVSMHLIVNLLRNGATVGTIDVDARQGTLSRYIENRQRTFEKTKQDIPIPNHIAIYKSDKRHLDDTEKEESDRLLAAIDQHNGCDYIVIDTPGSDMYLSRVAHAQADTLITPINDSFIDLDVIVRLDSDSMDILKPSTYAEMVWEQKKQRAISNGGSIDWIVLRNRLSNLASRNMTEMQNVLNALSKRFAFRSLAGFGERVIFRELFLSGLTLLDMHSVDMKLSMSHLAAKQELSELIKAIEIPVQKRLKGKMAA